MEIKGSKSKVQSKGLRFGRYQFKLGYVSGMQLALACSDLMLKDFKAFQLSKKLYQRCKILKLPVMVRDQLLRASLSISLNLAESSGKRTEKDRIRYFTMALGSLRECEALIDLEDIHDPEILDSLRQLGAVLFTLCKLGNQAKGKTRDSTLNSDL